MAERADTRAGTSDEARPGPLPAAELARRALGLGELARCCPVHAAFMLGLGPWAELAPCEDPRIALAAAGVPPGGPGTGAARLRSLADALLRQGVGDRVAGPGSALFVGTGPADRDALRGADIPRACEAARAAAATATACLDPDARVPDYRAGRACVAALLGAVGAVEDAWREGGRARGGDEGSRARAAAALGLAWRAFLETYERAEGFPARGSAASLARAIRAARALA